MKKKKFLNEKSFLRTRFDIDLVLDIIFLNVFGLIMIYSASYYYVSNGKQAYDSFFWNQLKYVAIGLVFMIGIAYIRPSFWKHKFFIWGGFAVSLILIGAVKLPGLRHPVNGAYRWIALGGFTLQVAEPIKLFMIIFLAGMILEKKRFDRRQCWKVLFLTGLVAGSLAIISNNFSTGLIIMLMAFLTCMIFYRKPKWFIIILVSFVVIAVVGLYVIQNVLPYSATEDFRITRIRAWMDPNNELFVDDTAYQSIQALYAIASGGFFGKGLGQSLVKFKLPEPHNDYILAIIFEELGIFGVILLTFLFVYLFYKLVRIYMDTHKAFNRILVLGVLLHLSLQVMLNYAVTLGLLPTTGVTLPFISAGGSAVVFTLSELGLAIAVDRQNKEDALYKTAFQEAENEDPYYHRIMEEQREEEKRMSKTKPVKKSFWKKLFKKKPPVQKTSAKNKTGNGASRKRKKVL